MIIVLKPHTSDESIKKIEDVIRARGLNHMFLKEKSKQLLEWLEIQLKLILKQSK